MSPRVCLLPRGSVRGEGKDRPDQGPGATLKPTPCTRSACLTAWGATERNHHVPCDDHAGDGSLTTCGHVGGAACVSRREFEKAKAGKAPVSKQVLGKMRALPPPPGSLLGFRATSCPLPSRRAWYKGGGPSVLGLPRSHDIVTGDTSCRFVPKTEGRAAPEGGNGLLHGGRAVS